MSEKKVAQSVERRALHIAAVIMEADGMCRYEDVEKCRRVYPTSEACVECIEKWLLAKARSEIKEEEDE
ncbi:MAG: hypothetical protein IJD20_03520 [Oscillospiraceae bacterium]|nr:hypothetical protein [Oscillospiraceae bacterium]